MPLNAQISSPSFHFRSFRQFEPIDTLRLFSLIPRFLVHHISTMALPCKSHNSLRARSMQPSRLIARNHFDIPLSPRKGHRTDFHLSQNLVSFLFKYTSTSQDRSLPPSNPSQLEASTFESDPFPPTLPLNFEQLSPRSHINICVRDLLSR